mgnify:CR=1 FL=1
MQFNGSLEDLKAVVAQLQLPGHWIDEGTLHIFSSDSGEHINVWPASGTIEVVGHPQAISELEGRLSQALTALGSE